MAFLNWDDLELPLTVNHQAWDNSWICSPYTHYVSYAQTEISHAVAKWVSRPVNAGIRRLGSWLQSAEFNKVVMVNNWLMSTNPWPYTGTRLVSDMLHAARDQWPDHALVFRSLNEIESARLLVELESLGARIIPSRQIWWFAPESQRIKNSRDLRKDAKLLGRGDLRIVQHEELSEHAIAELVPFYDALYLSKYSQHNPQYTREWLQHWWRTGALNFTALQSHHGAWLGMEACGEVYGTLVSPIVGYDLGAPREWGLYRRLAALPVLRSQKEQIPLNLSAGVGPFKALRGGRPVIEYIAVVDHHLPVVRRRPWSIIEKLSRHVLAPVVQRLGL